MPYNHALTFLKGLLNPESMMTHGPDSPRIGQLIEVIHTGLSFGDYTEGDRGIINGVRPHPSDSTKPPNITVDWLTNLGDAIGGNEARCSLLYPSEYRIVDTNDEFSVTHALGS